MTGAAAGAGTRCEPARFEFRAALPLPARDGRSGMTYQTGWVRDSRGYEWRLLYLPHGHNKEGQAVDMYLQINPASTVSAPFMPLAACFWGARPRGGRG
jgi:hypothetical protein